MLLTGVAMAWLFDPASFAQADQGSVCLIPISKSWADVMTAENLICPAENYRVKFDGHRAFEWPSKESVEIDDLDTSQKHKIVLYCGKKDIQKLTIEFSKFKSTRLALSLGQGQTHLWASLYSACWQAEESTRR
jgi:hypothetical protein